VTSNKKQKEIFASSTLGTKSISELSCCLARQVSGSKLNPAMIEVFPLVMVRASAKSPPDHALARLTPERYLCWPTPRARKRVRWVMANHGRTLGEAL
jgi:hypothetical protein